MTAMKLGELIRTLDVLPDAPVHITRLLLTPTEFRSYRGDYARLALGYSVRRDDVGSKELLRRARLVCGELLEGYKGGFYRMQPSTPVYLANWGDYPGACLTGVASRDEHGRPALILKFEADE